MPLSTLVTMASIPDIINKHAEFPTDPKWRYSLGPVDTGYCHWEVALSCDLVNSKPTTRVNS